MVCRLRLCSATQSARASASATIVSASTSTASCSPKIKVDVLGSKPSGSPKGFGRSPTIAFPGAVKTFTLSVFDATGEFTRVVSVSPFVPSIWYSFRCQSFDCSRQDWQNRDDESIGRTYHPCQSIDWMLRSGTGIIISERAPLDLLWGKCYEEDDDSDSWFSLI